MAFIHLRLRRSGGDLEWGYESTEISPAIGDKIYLYVADPNDEEQRECVEFRIKDREIVFAFHNDGDDEIFAEVTTEEKIEPGYVADSEVWPAAEYNERQADWERRFAKLKEGGDE